MTIAVIILVISLLPIRANRTEKHIPPKRTEKQKQTDELITVVLPTINDDN